MYFTPLLDAPDQDPGLGRSGSMREMNPQATAGGQPLARDSVFACTARFVVIVDFSGHNYIVSFYRIALSNLRDHWRGTSQSPCTLPNFRPTGEGNS